MGTPANSINHANAVSLLLDSHMDAAREHASAPYHQVRDDDGFDEPMADPPPDRLESDGTGNPPDAVGCA